MKADQRKQLEQNELSRRLSDVWKGSSDGRKSTSLWVVAAVVILIAVLIIAWRYFNDATTRNRASAWKQIEQATSAADLEAIAETHRGTDVGRVAKTQLARTLFNDGLSKLSVEPQRKEALASMEKARTLFTELITEASNDTLIVRESLLSAAKAEESLVGIPKADTPSESRGSLDKALQLYDQTVKDYEKTPQGKEAADRAKTIRENKQQIQQFYEDLNKRYVKADVPPLPEEPKPKDPPSADPAKPADKPADPAKPLTPPPADPAKPADKPANPAAQPLTPPPTKEPSKPADPPKAPAKPAEPGKPEKK